ncbi:MAG: polymorphic toxin-type HINT domain-containing protein [Microcoleaceae cyanobacterium]
MKLPAFAATATGPLKWLAVGGMGADIGFDIYGAGTATQNLVQSYRDDGDWEWQDSFNLLSYLPFIGAVGGVHRAIGSARATNGASNATSDAVASANNHVRSMSKTDVSIGGQCFVAGTEILTPEGSKNIEDIQVGDWVISDDPTTPGDIRKQQVLQTFIRQTDKLIDLYIDGEVLSTTEEHPFWVPDIGWVEAGDLEAGMRLQTDEETFVDIDRIEEREGDFEVYNFEVEEFHTYFVSDLEILVHNADCGDNLNWSHKSVPTFGHTFKVHGAGSKNTKKLTGRAASKGQSQGQWMNNQEAADLLKSVSENISEPTIIDIPDGLGQVIKPDGSIVPTNKALIVPKPNGGYRTGYPILGE